jgi:hypothetical protein
MRKWRYRLINLERIRAMASKYAIGDKVDQAFSNHAEGTIIAIFTDRAGECRYAVELSGHRTIQMASEASLLAHAAKSSI